MKHMNDYDLIVADQRFRRGSTPNRFALVLVVAHLAEETNMVSDGWAYWLPPRRAAQKAIALIESTTNAANDEQERNDITDAEMQAAVRPIRSFLTKHREIYSATARELILRAVND